MSEICSPFSDTEQVDRPKNIYKLRTTWLADPQRLGAPQPRLAGGFKVARLEDHPRRLQHPEILVHVFTALRLSKAFNAIRRFSEDIDPSFDRADLGYTGDRDPEQDGLSKKKAGQPIEDLVSDVEQHMAEKLMPALRAAIVEHLGEPADGAWSLEIDPNNAQTVSFHYPTALPPTEYESIGYITPRVKLELGARRSLADRGKDRPPLFGGGFSRLLQRAGRRYHRPVGPSHHLGKATAVHAEAHRPAESPMPQYFSRHYYDLAMLLDTAEGKAAGSDFELLAQVVKHKATFFRSGWASYDTAKPGTLRLTPDEARIKDLQADYRAMAPMMFDERPPTFNAILATLGKLRVTINSQGSGSGAN